MIPPKINIRLEAAGDFAAIHDVTARAFATMPFADGDEQLLPARFRGAGVLTLSLVAERDGALIGQATFTPATTSGASEGWYALGPVAVDPENQREGVGSMLINRGLDVLRDRGAAGCILVGNPDYYRRFGFRLSPEYCPDGEPAEYFQLLTLKGSGPSGKFAFHPLFYGEAG